MSLSSRTRVAAAVTAVAGVAGICVVVALRWPRSESAAAPWRDAGVQTERTEAFTARTAPRVTTAPSPAAPTPTLELARSGVPSITYLADTSDDPKVVEAALREVLTTYASRGSRKLAPDAELERVIVKHLSSPHPGVLTAALAAARIPLMTREPSSSVAKAVAELAEPDESASRRHAAIEALNLIRPDQRAPFVLSAFESALSASEPDVLSVTLFALAQSGPSLSALPDANRRNLARLVGELTDHADPGVRGRALGALAELDWLLAADARYSNGERHLRDAHPFVRGQAADLLFRCGQPMAIHALVLHTSDLELARYELRFSQVDGSDGVLLHSVPGRPRVAEAALLGMLTLAENVPGLERLTLTLTNQNSDAAVLQNAGIAQSWYRAHTAQIPRQPATR